MAKKLGLALLVWCLILATNQLAVADEEGWISLFDGKSFDGWKANENPDTFSIRDGAIVVNGPRSHLFYIGPAENHNFKNFELKVDVMTRPNSNSGVYFHTEYQESSWPAKGYEVQVNSSHPDWRKSGSLWAVQDVREATTDNKWFTEHIIVKGKHIVIKIDGKTVVDWIEPENWEPPSGMDGRKISSGTFALQGHDPGSTVYFKNIMVKPLPDNIGEHGWIELFNGENLDRWKVNEENPDTFSVRDGMIIVDGPRSHLFYAGPVNNADFKNFELRVRALTKPGANSGIYFHTEYQERGWPDKGYEVQVNNTHKDWRKTGSLYAVRDVRNSPAEDDEWFTEHIVVRGKHIVIKVNGKTTVDWTEPEDWDPPSRMSGRKISSGTFALQGHDPKSVIHYRSVKVKPLPEKEKIKAVILTGGHGFQREPFFKVFEGHDDIQYTEFQLKDHSEIFEDISDWDYDVIVLYNMSKQISPKRRRNFARLLREQGVGLVALHHMMGAYPDWPQYRKITGGKYFLKGASGHRGSTYKHDLDLHVHIEDTSHPITRGMSDFRIHDEGYKYCGFEADNHVLLTTEHPDCDKTIGWVRKVGKARVYGMMLGHDSHAYENPNFRKLVARAIRWTAGRLD
jgi:type 1 glutamine amidotransferase